MGSFANTLFSLLLGWLQGIVSMIWSALTDEGGNPFLLFIEKNWLKIIVVLCAVGVAADFAVYLFRWKPYKVWISYLKKMKSDRDPEPTEPVESVLEPDRMEHLLYTGSAGFTGINASAEKDDLDRWRETTPGFSEAGDSRQAAKDRGPEPEYSPYEKPETVSRRRRFRINRLLGDSGDDGEPHYYAPRPIVDRKEAYHAPVYPEKWTGGRDQES